MLPGLVDAHAAGEGPGFAHLPADRMGLAVPVIVGGRVVAVLYGDDQERSVPDEYLVGLARVAEHALDPGGGPVAVVQAADQDVDEVAGAWPLHTQPFFPSVRSFILIV